MVTLQEYLDKKYPTKEEKEKTEEINIYEINRELKTQGITEPLEAGELDLSEYVGLEEAFINDYNLTKLILGSMPNLKKIFCCNTDLISADFLNTLSNPKKLKEVLIASNNIQPTDISIFSKFINLKTLAIGVMVKQTYFGKRNKFYGSFESWKDLSNLEDICIEATDVDRGLEYLPFSLVKSQKVEREKDKSEDKANYWKIECSPHNTNAKCSAIQNELRPFNYDLEAWQLAHPEKMLIARPELFTSPDSKDKWLTALKNKVEASKKELSETDREKYAKIARLETKIQELELAKSTISQQTQTDFSTQNKGTQTELTAEQITNLEKQVDQLHKLLTATETEITNTKKQLTELTKNHTELTEEAKQLQSKIKLLEQQKENYQTKYDKSIEFIKEIREEVKEASVPFEINNSTPQTEEEIKWETIKTGIEKETDLTRLANGAHWDIQIQTLQDDLLPANKQSIVLKNRCWQREKQIEVRIENPQKKNN